MSPFLGRSRTQSFIPPSHSQLPCVSGLPTFFTSFFWTSLGSRAEGMATQRFLVPISVLIAILAIFAGSMMSPVMGRWDISPYTPVNTYLVDDVVGNSTGGQPTISSNSEKFFEGSFNILNNVINPLKISCHDQSSTVPPADLQPQDTFHQGFFILAGKTNQWNCDFEWDALSGPLTQSFEVWANLDPNTPYLSRTCQWTCNWSVEQDGFYFENADGTLTLEWKWIS